MIPAAEIQRVQNLISELQNELDSALASRSAEAADGISRSYRAPEALTKQIAMYQRLLRSYKKPNQNTIDC